MSGDTKQGDSSLLFSERSVCWSVYIQRADNNSVPEPYVGCVVYRQECTHSCCLRCAARRLNMDRTAHSKDECSAVDKKHTLILYPAVADQSPNLPDPLAELRDFHPK